MKGFRQAMLLEQMLKWASTIDQMTKKVPAKVGSSECTSLLAARSRKMVAAIILRSMISSGRTVLLVETPTVNVNQTLSPQKPSCQHPS